jgi:hypothetical protein
MLSGRSNLSSTVSRKASLSERWISLDFEAAKDRHGRLFPIEVGVANLQGHTWSSLIAPPSHWAVEATAYQPDLYAKALKHGRSTVDVAKDLQKILSDRSVILSDAAFIDQPLLVRLYEEGLPKHSPPQLTSFFDMLEDLDRVHRWGKEAINRNIVLIDAFRGPAHRAAEDARVRARLLAELLSGSR